MRTSDAVSTGLCFYWASLVPSIRLPSRGVDWMASTQVKWWGLCLFSGGNDVQQHLIPSGIGPVAYPVVLVKPWRS